MQRQQPNAKLCKTELQSFKVKSVEIQLTDIHKLLRDLVFQCAATFAHNHFVSTDRERILCLQPEKYTIYNYIANSVKRFLTYIKHIFCSLCTVYNIV